MAEEPHKIDREDPRFHAIQRLEEGTIQVVGTVPAVLLGGGAQARLFVHFGIPSMPAMCLDQALRSNVASGRTKVHLEPAPNSQNSLMPTEHKELFDLVEQKLVEIVMALTAIEAFANETIPDDLEMEIPVKKGRLKRMNKVQMERDLSLATKLNVVLPKACGVSSLSKTPLWGRFEKLKGLRDRLIHPKAADRRDQGPNDPSVWKDLLASLPDNFAADAHAIIGHFLPASTRRWHSLFPARYPSR